MEIELALVWTALLDKKTPRLRFSLLYIEFIQGQLVERCGSRSSLTSSTPASTKCCVLEQDTLSTLLSTDFYLGAPPRNTQKMRMLQYR